MLQGQVKQYTRDVIESLLKMGWTAPEGWGDIDTEQVAEIVFRSYDHDMYSGPKRFGDRYSPIGWENLTRAEKSIAAYVAEGLTNPEISVRLVISRRTVAQHISNILAKLAMRSRVEIAREYSAFTER